MPLLPLASTSTSGFSLSLYVDWPFSVKYLLEDMAFQTSQDWSQSFFTVMGCPHFEKWGTPVALLSFLVQELLRHMGPECCFEGLETGVMHASSSWLHPTVQQTLYQRIITHFNRSIFSGFLLKPLHGFLTKEFSPFWSWKCSTCYYRFRSFAWKMSGQSLPLFLGDFLLS